MLKLMEHPDYEAAVPTPDHFIPLLYLAGMAAAQNAPLLPLVRGYAIDLDDVLRPRSGRRSHR